LSKKQARRYKRVKSEETGVFGGVEMSKLDLDLEKPTTLVVADATVEAEKEEPATIMSLLRRPNTRMALMIYGFHSFIMTSTDEIFPLFSLAEVDKGGLGLLETKIGVILFGAGFVYIVCNYVMFKFFTKKFGTCIACCIGAAMSGPTFWLVSLSVYIGDDDHVEGELGTNVYLYLIFITGFFRCFGSLSFATVTLLGNDSVPAHQRATYNG